VGTLSSTDVDASNTFTYTLVAGTGSTDNASFNISGGSLRITASPDFETKNSYSVRIRTTDQGSLYFEKAFTITITNVNEAPADIALSASSINENVAANSTVGTLSSTDVDASDTFTYTLVAGTGSTDNASFNISGSSLRITASPDFETKSSYSVRVRTTDQGSLYFEKAFTITINDLNETPTDIALSASSINENVAANATVGTLSSTDVDASNTFTYALVAGTGSADNASFNISGGSLRITASPDFETKNSYSVRVRTTDQGSLYYEKAFTITINDLNETPTDIALSASSINENVAANSTVGTLSSTDVDASNTFTYTLVAGTGSTDNASFNISGGSLRITASPDFETKNSYSIRVRTTDQGSLYYEKAFTITINDLNETPTDIALSASSVNENVAANATVGTLSSTDPDAGNTFTYTLVAGTGSTDNASFNISGGSLRITASPDFETKNSYSVRIRTTDQGSLYYEKAFTITITNVNETPTDIALAPASINENVANNSPVGTLSTTDPDAGNSFTYSLVAGTGSTDNASFIISGSSLVVVSSLDFETKSSYSVRVRTTDQSGVLYFEKAFIISINDVNETPTDIALSPSSINENVASNTPVGTLSTTDPDAGNSFTYSLVAGTGSTDNASFNISGGSLRITASPDFETKNSYSVRIRTTDQGSLYYEKAFTVTISDLNDVAPVITALQVLHVTEQAPNGTTVGTVVATDGDVTPTTYQNWTITAGNGNGYFAINSSTGVITVVDNTGLNPFVNPDYTLTLTVSDGTNTSLSQTVSIIVDGVNDENPVITASQSFAIAENSANSATVGQVLATDPDYGTVFRNWTIATGNTGNAFAIDPSTGVIIVNNSATLDYETVSSFNLLVTVNDGLHTSAAQTVKVNLVDVNETPTDIALSKNSINENAAANSTVGMLSSTDPDGTDSFTYTLVSGEGDTGNASFTLSGNSLLMTNSPDFETNSSYSIRVRTTDLGGLYFEKVFTVNVNPAPVKPTADNNLFVYDGTEKTASATVAEGIAIDWYGGPSGGNTISAPSGTNVGKYSAYAEARNPVTECVSTSRTLVTLEITKAMLTLTADAQTKVYGEANPELTFKYSGFVNGDKESDLDTKPVAITTVGLAAAVGTYVDDITLSGGFDNNYDFTYVANSFEVTKAMLTVTADAQTKVYGEANPELTFKYSGFVNGDKESDLDTKPVAITTVDLTTAVGTYMDDITLSGGFDNNYDFTYVANNFEVTKAMLTISGAMVENKVYDGNTNAVITGATLSGVAGTDDVVLGNHTSGTFAQAGIGTGIDVTTAMTISGAAINNYTLIQPAGLKADITAKELLVNGAVASDKVYDGTAIAAITGASLVGVVGTENVVLSGSTAGTFAQATVGTDIAVTPAMTITGTDIANYTLAQPTGLKATITAKPLTVSNTVVITNKMVDGNTVAAITSPGTLQGVVAPDLDNVAFSASADYADANVGVNKTITVVYTLSGSAMGNYIAPVNLVITGAKISDHVTLSPVITATPGCEGSDMNLAYTILSGSSTEYRITFNAAALEAGFQNISYTSLPTSTGSGVIPIPIPDGTPEGAYEGTLQMRNELGVESPAYSFQFSVRLSSDYIIAKFTDVVLCDNSSKRFTAYQWYKDGIKIEGATKQFYCDPNGLVGAYSLEVKTTDGLTLVSCAMDLNIPSPKKVEAYPNPLKSQEVCTVKVQGFTDEELKNSELSVYNMQGVRVYQTKEVKLFNQMSLPAVSGIYVGHVTDHNGADYIFKIIVQQ